MKQYNELIESRDWCARHEYYGMQQWYDEELGFQARRRALPKGIQLEYDAQREAAEQSRRR
jgi:hypothetical protein